MIILKLLLLITLATCEELMFNFSETEYFHYHNGVIVDSKSNTPLVISVKVEDKWTIIYEKSSNYSKYIIAGGILLAVSLIVAATLFGIFFIHRRLRRRIIRDYIPLL